MTLIERARSGSADGTVGACDRRCSNDGQRPMRGRPWVRLCSQLGALGAIGHARRGRPIRRRSGLGPGSRALVKERLVASRSLRRQPGQAPGG
jgi:hypothetical protein